MRFEYTIFDRSFGKDEKQTEELLAKLGEQGWELVSVVKWSRGPLKDELQRLYLKKPVPT